MPGSNSSDFIPQFPLDRLLAHTLARTPGLTHNPSLEPAHTLARQLDHDLKRHLAKSQEFNQAIIQSDATQAQTLASELTTRLYQAQQLAIEFSQNLAANLGGPFGQVDNLSGIDLKGANLSNCILIGIDLSGTDLTHAIVENTIFANNRGLNMAARNQLQSRGAFFFDALQRL
jgi:hypothetical protein